MKAFQVMNKVLGLDVVEKRDIFFWHNDKGVFGCTISVHTKGHEREVFKALRELPKPATTNWRSYKPGRAVGFTCLTLTYGDYQTGRADIEVYIYDVD